MSGANLRGDTATEAPIRISELLTDPAGVPRARAMLQRAEWAGRAFARYDRASVDAIVRAAAAAGAARAREYAEWAVRETGFGVVEHKVLKNVACSTGVVEHYGDVIVTSRMDGDYDKSPFPDGLFLTYYFTVRDGRIVRLIIIRNKPAG